MSRRKKFDSDGFEMLDTDCKPIHPKTENQRFFVNSILENTITIGVGSAGVGKTLLALYTGYKMINNPKYNINKIVYVRSNVGLDTERTIGALKGDLDDKLYALTLPVYDNLTEFVTFNKAEMLLKNKTITVLPMEFIRGCSFANTLIIGEEMQNSSFKAIKTLLSRISKDSKMVLIGDPSQVDIKHTTSKNPFLEVADRMYSSDLDYLDVVYFNRSDIVRHPIIADVLDLLI